MSDAMHERFKASLKWLIFSVGFALGPLYANWIVLHSPPDTFDLVKLYNHGELFIISAALAAESISRLFTPLSKIPYYKIFLLAAVSVILAGSMMEYGSAAPALLREFKPEAMPNDQATRSLWYIEAMILIGIFIRFNTAEE